MATRRPAARAAPSPLVPVLAVLLLAATSLPAAGAGRRLQRGRRGPRGLLRSPKASGDADDAGPAEEDPERSGDAPEEVIEVVANLEQTIEELDATGAGGGMAEQAEEALLDEAESLIAATFPEGCTWECYLDNNADLKKKQTYKTEQQAINHWLHVGRDHGRNCRCSVEDPGVDRGEEDVVQEVEEIEELIENLEESGGTVEEVEELEEEAEMLIEETFPEGCTWECYLDNNADFFLKKQMYKTEQQVIHHWLHAGRDHGWNCRCSVEDPGMDGGEEEVVQAVEEIEELIEDLEELGGAVTEMEVEELEEEAESLIEETFPEGCTWECYLDNYTGLKKQYNTEEEALEHWLLVGRDRGRICRCKTEDVGEDEVAEMVEETEMTFQQLGNVNEKGSNVSEKDDGTENDSGTKQLFGWEFFKGWGAGVASMSVFFLLYAAYKRRASRFPPIRGSSSDECDGDNYSYRDNPELT